MDHFVFKWRKHIFEPKARYWLPRVMSDEDYTQSQRCHEILKYQGLISPVSENFLDRLWTHLNEVYFHGELQQPKICWGLEEWSQPLGMFRIKSNQITLNINLICPPHKKRWGLGSYGIRELYGIMCHEMMHQAIHNRGDYESNGQTDFGDSHNFPSWISEINRIQSIVGLESKAKVLNHVTSEDNLSIEWEAVEGFMSYHELKYFTPPAPSKAEWKHIVEPFVQLYDYNIEGEEATGEELVCFNERTLWPHRGLVTSMPNIRGPLLNKFRRWLADEREKMHLLSLKNKMQEKFVQKVNECIVRSDKNPNDESAFADLMTYASENSISPDEVEQIMLTMCQREGIKPPTFE